MNAESVITAYQVFHDVGDSRLISSDAITRSEFLGKGAFGAVYSGTVISHVSKCCSLKDSNLTLLVLLLSMNVIIIT